MSSPFHALTERLNSVFSSGNLEPARLAKLFEPKPANTLLRAALELGVARTLEEMEAIQSLPMTLQVTLRTLLWENLRRRPPIAVHWLWAPGCVPELRIWETPGAITVFLNTPR